MFVEPKGNDEYLSKSSERYGFTISLLNTSPIPSQLSVNET